MASPRVSAQHSFVYFENFLENLFYPLILTPGAWMQYSLCAYVKTMLPGHSHFLFTTKPDFRSLNACLLRLAHQCSCSMPATAYTCAVNLAKFFYRGCELPTSPTYAGNWHGAVTFGLSVAVALTPQMLPMIVTVNLVQCVRQLRKQRFVVKRLDAVQNLGAM